MKIGQKIKLKREQIGLSVDELAEILGKNRATIFQARKYAIFGIIDSSGLKDYLTFIARKCAVLRLFMPTIMTIKKMHKFSSWICASIQNYEFA